MSSPLLAKDWRDHRSILDPKELAARLRAITPDVEEQIEAMKCQSKLDRDTLIDLGGRPTRPIRNEPVWRPGPGDGVLYVMNADLDQECNVLTEDLMDYHWGKESNKWEEDLRQWQDFRKYQQDKKHPLLAECKLESTNQELEVVLNALNDWREFEAWQQKKVDRATSLKEQCRRALDRIREEELVLRKTECSTAIHPELSHLLPLMKRRRLELVASEKHLTWIRSQYPEILKEAGVSLAGMPLLCHELGDRLALQATALCKVLERSGARQRLPVDTPTRFATWFPKAMHWTSVISRLLGEDREWRYFLKWQDWKLASKTVVEPSEGQSPLEGASTSITYQAFLQREVERAQERLECWQRLVQWREKEIEEWASKLSPYDARLHCLGDARANALEAQGAVAIAQARCEQLRQSLPESSLPATAKAHHQISLQQALPSPPRTASTSLDSQSQDQTADIPVPSLPTRPAPPKPKPKPKPKRNRPSKTSGPLKTVKVTKSSPKKPTRTSKTFTDKQRVALLAAVTPKLLERDGRDFKASYPQTTALGEVPYQSLLDQGVAGQVPQDIPDSVMTSNAANGPSVPSSPVQRNRRGRKPKSGTGESLARPAKVTKNARQKQMIDPKTLADQQHSLLMNAAASANDHSHAPPTSFDPHQQHATHHHKIATQNLSVRPDATPIRKSERIRHLAEQSLSATMAASSQHQKHYDAEL